MLTITERKTGFLFMADTGGKKAKEVAKQSINTLAPFKNGCIPSQMTMARSTLNINMWHANLRQMCSLLTHTHLGKRSQ